MKRTAVALAVLFSSVLLARDKGKVYCDSRDSFCAYFTSAIQKKKVPVTVTTDPKRAQYSLKFQAKNSDGSLLQGIASAVNNGAYNSGAFSEMTLTVIDNQTKDVSYSYTCKKYNQYSGSDSRMASSVAECLAKHWKSNFPKQ